MDFEADDYVSITALSEETAESSETESDDSEQAKYIGETSDYGSDDSGEENEDSAEHSDDGNENSAEEDEDSAERSEEEGSAENALREHGKGNLGRGIAQRGAFCGPYAMRSNYTMSYHRWHQNDRKQQRYSGASERG